MGNKNSRVTYEGTTAETIEGAAQSLEAALAKDYPGAFVTVGDPDFSSVLSPRGTLSRIAFAKIGDGKDYKVIFYRDGKFIRARVTI